MENTAKALEFEESTELVEAVKGIIQAGVLTRDDQNRINLLASKNIGPAGNMALLHLTEVIQTGKLRVE